MMNKSFSENTMEIINAIKEYRDKHGDDGIVEKYYEEHGTYTGIDVYLKRLESTLESKTSIKKTR